jgi:putative glycosyltransferase (TIGR04372 family)
VTNYSLRRFQQLAISLFSGIWAIPIVLLVRLVRPLILFRFGTIYSTRIGHFVADACEQRALLFKQTENSERRIVDWFWLPNNTSNKQWAVMVSRELPVKKFVRFLDFWNQKIVGGDAHHRPSSYTGSRDVKGLYADQRAIFSFTREENERGRQWLSSIGCQEEEKFICVLVRDSTFLPSDSVATGDHLGLKDWSYHNYRDSDIESYREGLEWLADQGVWIFRMGRKMARKIDSVHPRIYDYSFSEDRSDFLDIWLFANCHFCISTSTGPDQIAGIYGKPILYLNATPLGQLPSYYGCMWVPKNAVWKRTGEQLTLDQYLSNTHFASNSFRDAGVRLLSLSPFAIKLYIQEFWLRDQGNWEDTQDDLARHRRFWEVFESWDAYNNYHGWRHNQCQMSTSWLKAQSEKFFRGWNSLKNEIVD